MTAQTFAQEYYDDGLSQESRLKAFNQNSLAPTFMVPSEKAQSFAPNFAPSTTQQSSEDYFNFFVESLKRLSADKQPQQANVENPVTETIWSTEQKTAEQSSGLALKKLQFTQLRQNIQLGYRLQFKRFDLNFSGNFRQLFLTELQRIDQLSFTKQATSLVSQPSGQQENLMFQFGLNFKL